MTGEELARLISGQETVMLCHDCEVRQALPQVIMGGFVEVGRPAPTVEEGVERTAAQVQLMHMVLFYVFAHAGHRLRICTRTEAVREGWLPQDWRPA
jgi:hypothetical protein